MDRVKLALENATFTKDLVIGQGVLPRVASVFKVQFPGKRAVVIADKTTFGVAGARVCEILRQEGIAQDSPYIFDEQEMHAEWKYIERLDAHFKNTDAVPIAVGSGTINDLTKLSSFHTGRRYMTVATAAPMTSIRGKPKRPKIRMGSKHILKTAPTICGIMARSVRPVDCRRRSPQICPKSGKQKPMQTFRY